MGKPRTVKNYVEAGEVLNRYRYNDHMLLVAIVQLIEREKVRVLNSYLKERGEPLLPTDPPYLPGGQPFEWLIDVPKEWYSLTGKDRS